jgi:dTDP-4-amino-4,6-dideoxygalactose transaminase
MGYQKQDFPEAESYYAEAISIPMYVTLTEDQQSEVVERIVTPIGYQNLF